MNILAKLNEILLDLREIKNPSQIEHQAKKLEKVVEQMGWQPIESAPKDGTHVLFHVPQPEHFHPARLIQIGRADDYWNKALWCIDATHWKPLPEPPDPDITPNVHGSGTGND